MGGYMNVLSNLIFPSSSKIKLIPFGKTSDYSLQYDYEQPFSEFVKVAQKQNDIDAVFLYYPEYHAIPPKIEEIGIPTFALVSDWNLGFFPLQKNLKRFDWIVTDKKGCNTFRSMGYHKIFHWNMYGYNPTSFNELPKVEKEWDVVFVGNVNPNIQKERLQFLKRLFDISHKLRVRVETGLFGDEYVNALCSAKVVFNRSIRGEANMRVFEALASETVIFLESTNQEIRDYFLEGDECVLYEDDAFEETIERIVNNDADRERIVKNATLKKKDYSYPALLDKLYEIISEKDALRLDAPRTYFELSNAEQVYHQSVHSYFASATQFTPSQATAYLRESVRIAQNSVHSGLLLYDFYRKVAISDTLTEAEISIGQRLFQFLKQHPEGRVVNYFNYSKILEKLQNIQAEKEVLKELWALLDRDVIAPVEFEGLPCLLLNEEFFQEFNIYRFEGGDAFLSHYRSIFMNLVLTRLAKISHGDSEDAEAAALLDRANRLFGMNPSTHYLFGCIYFSVNPVVSIRAFKTTFLLNPLCPAYWKEIVTSCLAFDRPEEALDLIIQMQRLVSLAQKLYLFEPTELEPLKVLAERALQKQ